MSYTVCFVSFLRGSPVVSSEDVDTIRHCLESHGFTANSVYKNRLVLDFSGTASDVHEAFHSESSRAVGITSDFCHPRCPLGCRRVYAKLKRKRLA